MAKIILKPRGPGITSVIAASRQLGETNTVKAYMEYMGDIDFRAWEIAGQYEPHSKTGEVDRWEKYQDAAFSRVPRLLLVVLR